MKAIPKFHMKITKIIKTMIFLIEKTIKNLKRYKNPKKKKKFFWQKCEKKIINKNFKIFKNFKNLKNFKFKNKLKMLN